MSKTGYIFIPVAVYYVQAIQNCPAKGGAIMDTYEKLIAWGLQMSLRYQKYLQKIPKLGRVDDDTGVKVAQFIDMPGVDPADTIRDQINKRPDMPFSGDSEDDRETWRLNYPGVFLAIVDYGFYSAYTDDFSDAPTYMAVKLMCYNSYRKIDLSGASGVYVDDLCVYKAALFFGANGYCVMDPSSELLAVWHALDYTDKLERAIKRRIGMVYDAPEIWKDKESEVELQDKEGMGWITTWSTPWRTEYYRRQRERYTECHRKQDIFNVK